MRSVALSVIAVLALSSCAGAVEGVTGPDYPAEQMNKDVVRTVNRNAEQYGLGQTNRAKSADCEDMQTIEKGAIADCTVTFANGDEFLIRMTMQDDEGHFVLNQF